MRFFKREPQDDTASIEAFWRWWATDRDRIAAAIEDESLQAWVRPISDHVHAIDGGLAWELSQGKSSQHALVVSPEGDPELRARALAWLASAPPADGVWEYHASRQAGPLGKLEVNGLDLDLSEFRAITSWDEARERLDVRLWHPVLESVSDDARQPAMYLFLDNLFGEDDVERWIGSIDGLDAPTGGRTPEELRAELERRASNATGELWTLAKIKHGRDEALAVLNLTIKPIDHPDCRFHLAVTVARGLEQLANSDEGADLDAAEDRLVESLRASGIVHLGHVTTRRERVIHFMCPNADQAKEIAATWAEAEKRFGPRVEVKSDPRWDIRHTLGM